MSRGVRARIERMSQRTRRIVGVASLLGLPAMYGWSSFWLSTSAPSLVWGPVSFLLIGMTVIGAVVLYAFVRDRADLNGGGLDERQLELRDRAYVASYGILSVVVVAILATLAVPVLGFGRQIVLDATSVTAAAISIGTLVPLLPVAALAWVEPDVLEDA